MSKVLAIMGSPRIKGNTNILCKRFVEMLKKNTSCEVYVANIGLKNNIHPCRSCGMCDVGCPINDDIKEIVKQFDKSDFIVWFTPVYFFQMSGHSKILLDRLGASYKWENKKFYFVFVSGSYGKEGGVDLLSEAMQRTAVWHNFQLVTYYNKVTEDNILPVTKEDTDFFVKVIEDIKQRCNNEVKKG